MSKTLKTGKLNKFILIKSLTYPQVSLSMVFPKMPDVKIEIKSNEEGFKLFLLRQT